MSGFVLVSNAASRTSRPLKMWLEPTSTLVTNLNTSRNSIHVSQQEI